MEGSPRRRSRQEIPSRDLLFRQKEHGSDHGILRRLRFARSHVGGRQKGGGSRTRFHRVRPRRFHGTGPRGLAFLQGRRRSSQVPHRTLREPRDEGHPAGIRLYQVLQGSDRRAAGRSDPHGRISEGGRAPQVPIRRQGGRRRSRADPRRPTPRFGHGLGGRRGQGHRSGIHRLRAGGTRRRVVAERILPRGHPPGLLRQPHTRGTDRRGCGSHLECICCRPQGGRHGRCPDQGHRDRNRRFHGVGGLPNGAGVRGRTKVAAVRRRGPPAAIEEGGAEGGRQLHDRTPHRWNRALVFRNEGRQCGRIGRLRTKETKQNKTNSGRL
mmetsp:Transcript_6926/g.14043  ORF Transcript_6926/g.14043 Transcript_6926/m.14043 type:complete len:325 (-) Transcript_6926:134-1108(-)